MKRFTRSIVLLACAGWAAPKVVLARDVAEVNWNATVREYCHVLRFPLGWQMPKFIPKKDGSLAVVPKFDLSGDYEFRVAGLLGTRFLVRGLENNGRKYYTLNIYETDLFNRKGIAQPVGEEKWNSAAVVPLIRGAFSNGVKLPNRYPKYVEFQGLQFMSTGDHWEGTLISPDRAVLILQSWSGKLAPSGGGDVPGDFSISFKFGRSRGKLFFDVYETDGAKKLITFTANFVHILPEEVFGKTGWVTERYFFVPLDESRERCLICEFGRKR